MMHRLVFAGCLLWGAAAGAQSLEGVGRISLMPGWRLTPNDHFAQSTRDAGHPLSGRSLGGPQGVGTFAYAATSQVEVAIDLFAGYETLKVDGADALGSLTYGALVSARTFWRLGRFVPYAGLGLGPTLSYVNGGPAGQGTERLVTGYAVLGGVTFLATDQWGLSLDARWLWARGQAEGLGSVNVGGLWAGIGFTWLFAAEPSR